MTKEERQRAIDYCRKVLTKINDDTLDDYNDGKISKEQMRDVIAAQELARKHAKEADSEKEKLC